MVCYGVLEECDDMIVDCDGGHQCPHHNQEEKQTEIGPGVLSKKTFYSLPLSLLSLPLYHPHLLLKSW